MKLKTAALSRTVLCASSPNPFNCPKNRCRDDTPFRELRERFVSPEIRRFGNALFKRSQDKEGGPFQPSVDVSEAFVASSQQSFRIRKSFAYGYYENAKHPALAPLERGTLLYH